MEEQRQLKHLFGPDQARRLAGMIGAVYPDFPRARFVQVLDDQLGALELKARVDLFAAALRESLPPAYPDALRILLTTLDQLAEGDAGFWLLPLPAFVGAYGREHPELSLDALYRITPYITAEFAIRPFIVEQNDLTMSRLREWARDPNEHVRRLVSEGTRPRLPWAPILPRFIADPTSILPLLEMLRADPADYVRRSVANNLNDIARDHPALVLEIARRWWDEGVPESHLIVRHALRTLVKRGDPAALALLGFDHGAQLSLVSFAATPATISVGGHATLDLTLRNDSPQDEQVAIDYIVHYVKANRSTSPKVFKWATRQLATGETIQLRKRHSLRPITTRVHYPGLHRVEVQVNGKVLGGASFELLQTGDNANG